MATAQGVEKEVGLRVVVAEDEALVRLDLSEMLKEQGFDVCAAVANGALAVDAARKHRPDVVLLDVAMPVRDGISAAEQIIAENIAPVVLLTAFGEHDRVIKAGDAGVFGYLIKPYTQMEVVATLTLAVRRWRDFIAMSAEIEQVREKSAGQETIHLAKKLLEEQGLTEEQAFSFMRRSAMDQRITLLEVATLTLTRLGAQSR